MIQHAYMPRAGDLLLCRSVLKVTIASIEKGTLVMVLNDYQETIEDSSGKQCVDMLVQIVGSKVYTLRWFERSGIDLEGFDSWFDLLARKT